MKKLLPSILVIILFISCEKTITYTSSTDSYSTKDFTICNSQPCPEIMLSVLHMETPEEAAITVNNWVQTSTINTLYNETESLPSSINDAIELYINNSQISYPETTELSDAHEITIESAISFGSNNLLSVVFYSYQFMGGASGFDNEMYLNINPQTGKEYSDDELLDDDFYAFAKAQFEKEYPQETFDVTPSNLPDSYLQEVGFTEEGIVLIYNDMGVSSFNMEDKQITIPWELSQDYLTL